MLTIFGSIIIYLAMAAAAFVLGNIAAAEAVVLCFCVLPGLLGMPLYGFCRRAGRVAYE